VKAPRVLESPVAFECRLTQIIQLQTAAKEPLSTFVTFGEVIGVHIDQRLLIDGVYDTSQAQHIARGGGPADYFKIGPEQLVRIYRPKKLS